MPTTINLTDEQTQKLDRIREQQGFEYRPQAMNYAMDYVLGTQKDSKQEAKQRCEHLSSDGTYCGKDFKASGKCKKTNTAQCELCERESEIDNKNTEKLQRDASRIVTLRNEILYQRRHIAELEAQPNQDLITQTNLWSSERGNLKSALIVRDEKIDMLSANITMLHGQLAELSHDALFEQNQWLKSELAQEKQRNEDYKRDIEKEIALREKQAQTHNEEIARFKNALNDMQRFIPQSSACQLCVSGFEVLDYIRSISKQIEKLQAHMPVATPQTS